jgi:hypothetical protein
MAQLALEIQGNDPNDPLLPAASTIPSSFSSALDTVSCSPLLLMRIDIQLLISLDTAYGDVLRIRGDVEEATRLTDALKSQTNVVLVRVTSRSC